MQVGSEGSRAASVGVMGMFVQHLFAGSGGVFSKIQEVSSTKHLMTLCCVLGTGLGAMVGEETP